VSSIENICNKLAAYFNVIVETRQWRKSSAVFIFLLILSSKELSGFTLGTVKYTWQLAFFCLSFSLKTSDFKNAWLSLSFWIQEFLQNELVFKALLVESFVLFLRKQKSLLS